MQRYQSWFDSRLNDIKRDFFQFLRFPSISADPPHRRDVLACAQWLKQWLEKGGLRTQFLETAGYPIVFAETAPSPPCKETVLFYGHYDVQPTDPLEEWASPPFEPTEREGQIYARGAADDKGQIFYACLAVMAQKQLNASLPVHVKLCIEGEEEVSSKNLFPALPSLREILRADSLVVVDFDSLPNGTPAITLSARGLASLDVTLRGSLADLHSGVYGGLAYNPNRALAELLAHIWDEQGRVTVPGFYDGVVEPKDEEKKEYTYLYDAHSLARDYGIAALGGEKGKSLMEANWFRPTVEINGMRGGYTGSGVKTVIPKEAFAKLSCRLVFQQDPAKILSSLSDFLKHRAPPGIHVDVALTGASHPFQGSPSSKIARAIAEAAAKATGERCAHIASGASIPIVADMQRILQCEVAGMGYTLPSDRIHAPNEHFDMQRLNKGFLTVAQTLERL